MNPWLAARRVLAVRLDNAGDVVMLGPALRAVKAALPDSEVTLLASPAGALAAELLPWIDETIVWRAIWQDLGRLPFDPARERELIDRLAARRFDAALVFTSFSQTPHAPAYTLYLAGVPLRAGESKEFGGAALTTELHGAPDGLHQVERNLRLVEAVGFEVRDRDLAVHLSDAARAAVPALLGRAGLDPARPYLLLHPGASAAARRYPAARLGEAVRLLATRGHQLLVTGVEKEGEAVAAVRAAAPGAGVLLGGTTLPQYAALVERAALVVCGNTLPLHLADALATPVLALYSGTDLESQWTPRRTRHRLLRVPTACHPCYLFDCPIGQPCLDIAPEAVADEAGWLLAEATLPPVIPRHEESVRSGSGRTRTRTDSSCLGMTGERSDALDASIAAVQSTAPVREPGVRRIAVFQALALGDLLCATPALRALRDSFPTAEVTLIGLPWAAEMVRRLDTLDHFLPFPGYPGIGEAPFDAEATEAFLNQVRVEPFDLAIQMHGSGVASNGFVAGLGARQTLGYRLGRDDRLDLSLEWVEQEPEPLRWLRLVAPLGAPPDSQANRPPEGSEVPRLEFSPTRADDDRAEALLGASPPGGPIVVLHAGASRPAKRWPAERFALLGDRLASRFGARIVLSGTAAEAPLTAAARAAMTAPALDLAGRTDLGAFAALLARSVLLVTNDTGASHLAVAVRTPSVVLFGPTPLARWAPLDRRRHRVVDARRFVGAGTAGDGTEALRVLAVEPVFAACAEVLASSSVAGGRDRDHLQGDTASGHSADARSRPHSNVAVPSAVAESSARSAPSASHASAAAGAVLATRSPMRASTFPNAGAPMVAPTNHARTSAVHLLDSPTPRLVTRRDLTMRRLNILIWHIHGSYLNALARVDHDWFVPTKPGRPEGYGGRGATFDLPERVREVPAERVRELDLDLIVYQTPKNLTVDAQEILSLAQRRLPAIYLEHNTPKPDAVGTRHLVADPGTPPGPLLVHVTHYNRLMWDNGEVPTIVVEHSVAIDPNLRATGELARGVAVVNGMERRPRIAGYDFFLQARRRVPLDAVGMGTEAIGGLGDVPYRDLHRRLASYRFLFSPMRYSSLPLAVVEAMTLGLPVVALATTELPTVVEHGVSGFVSCDPEALVDGMRLLLADPALARRMGERGREIAAARFGLDRFRRDWNAAFARAIALNQEHPAPTSAPPELDALAVPESGALATSEPELVAAGDERRTL